MQAVRRFRCIYNRSTVKAEDVKTEEWAKGVVINFARAPKGGDIDQINSVAVGEYGVAVSNTVSPDYLIS